MNVTRMPIITGRHLPTVHSLSPRGQDSARCIGKFGRNGKRRRRMGSVHIRYTGQIPKIVMGAAHALHARGAGRRFLSHFSLFPWFVIDAYYTFIPTPAPAPLVCGVLGSGTLPVRLHPATACTAHHCLHPGTCTLSKQLHSRSYPIPGL